jgi:hypothetical protein
MRRTLKLNTETARNALAVAQALTNPTNEDEAGEDSQSIDRFCLRNDICRSTFERMRDEGRAPKTFRLGRRILITKEAAAEWRRQMDEQVGG